MAANVIFPTLFSHFLYQRSSMVKHGPAIFGAFCWGERAFFKHLGVHRDPDGIFQEGRLIRQLPSQLIQGPHGSLGPQGGGPQPTTKEQKTAGILSLEHPKLKHISKMVRKIPHLFRICMDVNISQSCSTYNIETLKDP